MAPFIIIRKNHTVIKANFMMGLNMEKAIKYSSMEINIQAHLSKTSFMVKASTNGKTEPNTKGHFIKVKSTVKVFWFSQTENHSTNTMIITDRLISKIILIKKIKAPFKAADYLS